MENGCIVFGERRGEDWLLIYSTAIIHLRIYLNQIIMGSRRLSAMFTDPTGPPASSSSSSLDIQIIRPEVCNLNI